MSRHSPGRLLASFRDSLGSGGRFSNDKIRLCSEHVSCPRFVARELSGMFASCSGGGGCDERRCYGVRS